MIIRIDNCEYNKVNLVDLKSNSFTLYIQCFKKFNTTRDIYEFKTKNSKVYITANSVMKVMVPDYESLEQSLEDIVTSAIEDDLSIVKLVFVAY